MDHDPAASLPASGSLAAWLARTERVLGGAAALLLAAMVLLTTVDVVGRYFLGRPLAGAFELTEMAMGAMVFSSLPLVTLARQQVTVDLLAGAMPVAWWRMSRVLFDLVAAACLGVIAWQLWLKTGHLATAGETTATLRIAVYPLVAYMAALASVTVAVMLAMAWGDATGRLEGAA